MPKKRAAKKHWACFAKVILWDYEGRMERGEFSAAEYDLDSKDFCEFWVRQTLETLVGLVQEFNPNAQFKTEYRIWKR